MIVQPLTSPPSAPNSKTITPSSDVKPWPGLIETYRPYLPVTENTPVFTLLEGNTPLIPVPYISQQVGKGVKVFVKYDGLNLSLIHI